MQSLFDSELVIPSSAIKLALFDIDSTLISADKTVSARLSAEMLRIQNAGVQTAIASGRPLFASRWLIERLGLNGAGSFFNGALVFDSQTNKIVREAPVEAAQVQALVSFAREHALYCECYSFADYFVDASHEYQRIHEQYLDKLAKETDLLLLSEQEAIYKLVLVVDELQPEKMRLLDTMKKAFPELRFAAGHGTSHPHLHFVSVVSAKADKQLVFDCLLETYQCNAQQVIAFGDGESDQVFLERAGIGVAMGNARESVQRYANYVTAPVWDDGVAQALHRLLP